MTNTPSSTQEKFDVALSILLEDEGGYSNHPADPGGSTNFGITQRELTRCYKKLHLPAKTIDLSVDDAKRYYKSEWWNKYNYEAINSEYVASKIFNMSVNMGAKESHMVAQRAINYCGYNLQIDGVLGRKTLSAINEIILSAREEDLRYELIDEQKWFYEHLVEEKPVLKMFLTGWLNRAEY